MLDPNGKLPASIGALGPQGERGKDGKDGKTARRQGRQDRDEPVGNVDGNEISASSGKPTFTHTFTGEWELTFGENVENCALLATKTGQRAGTDIGAFPHGNTVIVVTYISDSGRFEGVDTPFSLAVLC